jgi:hypothetical protein
LRRLLLLPFLGEARKGSSRRSTTGQQSRNYDKIINKTKPQQTQNSMPPARISHAGYRPMCLKKRMEYGQWRCRFEITYGVIDEADYTLAS